MPKFHVGCFLISFRQHVQKNVDYIDRCFYLTHLDKIVTEKKNVITKCKTSRFEVKAGSFNENLIPIFFVSFERLRASHRLKFAKKRLCLCKVIICYYDFHFKLIKIIFSGDSRSTATD